MNVVLSDMQLWERYKAGDAYAEELLVKRYSKVVRSCARPYFLLGGDSEDLMQEGMLGLIAAVRQYDPMRDASFKTYAEQCIKNRLYTAIKSAARMKHTPLNEYISIESPGFDEARNFASGSARNPEELFILKEHLREITDNADSFLSKLEAQVLSLYLDGQSYDEIAAVLGKSGKSVDNAIQRIRKKLDKLS